MFTYQDAMESGAPVHSIAESPLDAVRPVGPDADPAAFLEANRPECEEMLIVDRRAELGPAQWVENKLNTMLGGAPAPVSHSRMLSQLGTRSHC